MPVLTKAELINDPAVRQEIDRYKWVESEKLGFDIGFDRAADEWLKTRVAPEKKLLRKAKKV